MESLSESARVALREIGAAGGFLPYADFTIKHGSDEKDSFRDPGKLPATALGQLKAAGLVFEGTIGGKECVMVPQEVARLIRSV